MTIRMSLAAWLLCGLSAACRGENQANPSGKKRPAPLVEVEKVQRQDAVVQRSYVVTLEPCEKASVVARVSGYVAALFADRGDRVKKGERLAVVESRELSDQEKQAHAQLEAANAVLTHAKEQAQRARALFAKNYISPAEADAAEAQLRSAEAQVRAAEAGLRLAKTRKGYAVIEAPFDAYVVERHVDIGAFVGPQGPALFSIANIKTMKAIAQIPQADVTFLRLGQEAMLTLDEVNDGPWKGRIVRMAPALEPLSRSMPVEIEFPNEDELLKPGMFGRITLELERIPSTILLPPQAVARKGNMGRAFVVKDGRAKEVLLTLGRTWPDGSVQVLDGLEEGEEVVTFGRELLRDGMEVRTAQKNNRGM